MNLFFENYGLFILMLFCLALTSAELVFYSKFTIELRDYLLLELEPKLRAKVKPCDLDFFQELKNKTLAKIIFKLPKLAKIIDRLSFKWLVDTIFSYLTCIICHTSLTVLFCGILTGIFQKDYILTIIAILVFTPISLIIKLIYKFL